MVYCAGKPMEKSRVEEFALEEFALEEFVNRRIRTRRIRKEFEEFVNHSPAASDLQILLVFYQHPAWFISL